MKDLRQLFLGIIIALASLGLILGGFSLSLAEGNITTTLAPTHTLMPTYPPNLQSFTPSPYSLTPLTTLTPTPSPTLTSTPSPTLTPTPSPTWTPTWTPSLPPLPTNCPPPVGWLPYIVQSGDTLAKIAAHYRVSVAELQQANCLLTTDLLPGMVIYVPPVPTQTPLPCGRPYGWIVHIVQTGDTLYRLSLTYGISVVELQQANCMGSSTLLHVGQILYIPPWAARTPWPTASAAVTPTATPTNTPETSLPSDTPTEASTSTPTEPPAPTASDTPAEIPTETLTPTGP